MSGQTVVEKLAQAHLVQGPTRPVRAGDHVTLRPRHVMTHDNTAAVMKKFHGLGLSRIHDPTQPIFTLDHDIQDRSDTNLAKHRAMAQFAREQGVRFYPAGAGIGHQLMIEHGHATPGALVVASDSHSNMYGAVGALGTPVVRTDAAVIWATGSFWWQIPATVQVVLQGQLPPGVTGKDLILTLCGLYGEEVLNRVVEFGGPGVASITMDGRMTVANMTTEWGALAGWFPVDAITLEFLARRRQRGAAISDADLRRWTEDPPRPDADARYEGRIVVDLDQIEPFVAGPDTVQTATPLHEMEQRQIQIHKAYLLSCVNARLEDLTAAAAVLRGQQVASGVELYVAAASQEVQQQAEASGVWDTLLRAGARTLPPGCGPCIGLGQGVLQPGEVGISATNRNFKGRMGSREARCYLASPVVVAASAVAGVICGPGQNARAHGRAPLRTPEWLPHFARRPGLSPGPDPAGGEPRWNAERHFELLSSIEPHEATQIVPGFPERLTGRLVYVPVDNLNTDGIYGNDFLYREEMTREQMARVVMANYDPEFAGRARPGDILVGGLNFGTGSSREQAATAMQACGIALVAAASFSQTYLRNAFNNGLCCIVAPRLVQHLRQLLAGQDHPRTVIPGDVLVVDFVQAQIGLGHDLFPFAPLGPVPQRLVLAGGVENQIRQTV